MSEPYITDGTLENKLHAHCSRQVRELAAQRDVLLLKIEAMRKVVEAAREVIGQNVTRPEVYEGRDTTKYKLAVALQALTEKTNDENQPEHDYTKFPNPKTCELCRLRIVGHTHVTKKRTCEHKTVPTFDGLGVRLKCQLCNEYVSE